MPKKMQNTKAVAANEKKAAIKDAASAASAAAAEDADWADNRKAKKHELKRAEGADSAADKAARKAADKLLAQEEDDEMSKLGAKGKGKASKGKAGGPKMTQAMINQAKEMRDAKEAKAKAKRDKQAANVVDEGDYANMVDSFQGNALVDETAGSGIDGALGALGGDKARLQAMAVASGAGQRAQNQAAGGRMTYKVFEAGRLIDLKVEKPGLKASQYRDMAKKEWGRSPMNPANQKD